MECRHRAELGRGEVKIEAELKQRFTKELKRQLPLFMILQYATAGAPDRELIYNGVTTRWEFKHATPSFDSSGDQELMCCRLAKAGHCRYVVWYQRRDVKRTLIVHPRLVLGQHGNIRDVASEAECVGFDMQWLVMQVMKAHRI